MSEPLLVGAVNWPIQFTDVTHKAGLKESLAGLMGHGGAWGDYNGDGKIDLFVGGFCDRPNSEYAPSPGPVPNQVFRNLGDGRFQRLEGFGTYARTSGAVFADLDNDGGLELYVANNAREARRGEVSNLQTFAQAHLCQLYKAIGNKLVDVSEASGACPPTLFSARNVGVLDYNRDGLLDLLVIEDRFTATPRSVLLKNLGGLRFQDANKEAGLPDDLFGLGLAVADLNEDGCADFFVPHSNRLFLSQPGHKYRECLELRSLFTWNPLSNEDWPCGAAFGDLNRDGRLDLVLSIHYKTARNRIYLNEGLRNGVPHFRDITDAAGLGTAVPARCPHVEIQDFDNDGWPDIYMSAAWREGTNVTPLIYRHDGTRNGIPRFTTVRKIEEPMIYFPAGPSGDFNNDGRIDLFMVNWFSDNHCRLLANESKLSHWLDVRIVGRTFNKMGIGTQVRLYRPEQTGKPEGLLGFQEITTGYGYASGQPAVAHFGLGSFEVVDLLVKLPNGKVVTRPAVQANQNVVIEEP